jgi:hypothetical protein
MEGTARLAPDSRLEKALTRKLFNLINFGPTRYRMTVRVNIW